MNVQKTGNIEAGVDNMIMVIGEPGCGKTLLAATASRNADKEVFVAAADPKGIVTLTTNGYNVDYAAISAKNPYQDAMDIAKYLAQPAQSAQYKVAVIDDVSNLQLKMKNWIYAAKKAEITTKNGNEDPRKVYGFLKTYMQNIANKFMDLPMTTIMLAWAKEGDPDSGKNGGSMLEGQSADWLEGMCGAVVMLRTKKESQDKQVTMVRELRTKPWNGYRLKNRFGWPDPFPISMTVTEDGRKPTVQSGMYELLRTKAVKRLTAVPTTQARAR